MAPIRNTINVCIVIGTGQKGTWTFADIVNSNVPKRIRDIFVTCWFIPWKIFKLFILVFFSFTFHALGENFNLTKNYSLKIFNNTDNIIKENNKSQEADIGITVDVNFFLEKAQKNNFKEIIITTKLDTTNYGGDIRTWFHSYFFKRADSIFKPNQNQNLYLKKKTNSIVVQDFNINKYLNNQKDDFKEVRLGLKKFLEKNSINIPESSLRSDHLYLKGDGSFFWITYIYNYHLMNKSLKTLNQN